MKTTLRSTPLRRFASVIAIAIVLPIISLTPVLLASLILTDQTVRLDESTDQAATIDITDIDPEGTVMYTIRPSTYQSTLPNNDVPSPHSLLADADIIKVNVQDDDAILGSPDVEMSDHCNFTFYLRSDAPYDNQNETFTGFVRLEDDEFWLRSDRDQLDNCGITLSLEYDE